MALDLDLARAECYQSVGARMWEWRNRRTRGSWYGVTHVGNYTGLLCFREAVSLADGIEWPRLEASETGTVKERVKHPRHT